MWFNSTGITKFTEGCILNHLDLLRTKASDILLPNPNCSSRSRNSLWGSERKLHLSNPCLVMGLQFFRERTGLVIGRVTRIGAVKGSSFPPHPAENSPCETQTSPNIWLCLLPGYAVIWTSLSCSYPTSLSPKAVWDRAFLKAKGNGEEKCLVADEKWDLNGAEKVRIPSVSLSCC